MTPREVIIRNIEFRCEGRIGFNFGGEGRLNDFVSAGYDCKIENQALGRG